MARVVNPLLNLLRRRTAPAAGPTLVVVRQTVSPDSFANLGIMHEARCKLCPPSDDVGGRHHGPDTLESTMKWVDRHFRREHPHYRVTGLRDVRLGTEHWE